MWEPWLWDQIRKEDEQNDHRIVDLSFIDHKNLFYDLAADDIKLQPTVQHSAMQTLPHEFPNSQHLRQPLLNLQQLPVDSNQSTLLRPSLNAPLVPSTSPTPSPKQRALPAAITGFSQNPYPSSQFPEQRIAPPAPPPLIIPPAQFVPPFSQTQYCEPLYDQFPPSQYLDPQGECAHGGERPTPASFNQAPSDFQASIQPQDLISKKVFPALASHAQSENPPGSVVPLPQYNQISEEVVQRRPPGREMESKAIQDAAPENENSAGDRGEGCSNDSQVSECNASSPARAKGKNREVQQRLFRYWVAAISANGSRGWRREKIAEFIVSKCSSQLPYNRQMWAHHFKKSKLRLTGGPASGYEEDDEAIIKEIAMDEALTASFNHGASVLLSFVEQIEKSVEILRNFFYGPTVGKGNGARANQATSSHPPQSMTCDLNDHYVSRWIQHHLSGSADQIDHKNLPSCLSVYNLSDALQDGGILVQANPSTMQGYSVCSSHQCCLGSLSKGAAPCAGTRACCTGSSDSSSQTATDRCSSRCVAGCRQCAKNGEGPVFNLLCPGKADTRYAHLEWAGQRHTVKRNRTVLAIPPDVAEPADLINLAPRVGSFHLSPTVTLLLFYYGTRKRIDYMASSLSSDVYVPSPTNTTPKNGCPSPPRGSFISNCTTVASGEDLPTSGAPSSTINSTAAGPESGVLSSSFFSGTSTPGVLVEDLPGVASACFADGRKAYLFRVPANAEEPKGKQQRLFLFIADAQTKVDGGKLLQVHSIAETTEEDLLRITTRSSTPNGSLSPCTSLKAEDNASPTVVLAGRKRPRSEEGNGHRICGLQSGQAWRPDPEESWPDPEQAWPGDAYRPWPESAESDQLDKSCYLGHWAGQNGGEASFWNSIG